MKLLSLLLFALPAFAETPYYIRLWPASLVRGMGLPGVPDDAPDVIQVNTQPTRNDTAKIIVYLVVRRGNDERVLKMEQKRDQTSAWTLLPIVLDERLEGLDLIRILIEEKPEPPATVTTDAVAPLRVLR